MIAFDLIYLISKQTNTPKAVQYTEHNVQKHCINNSKDKYNVLALTKKFDRLVNVCTE